MCRCWHWLLSPCQLLSQKSCISASSQCGLPSHSHFPFCSACREASKNCIWAPSMQLQGQFCWHRLQNNVDIAESLASVRPCAPQPHTAQLHTAQPHAVQHSHMQHSHTQHSHMECSTATCSSVRFPAQQRVPGACRGKLNAAQSMGRQQKCRTTYCMSGQKVLVPPACLELGSSQHVHTP